MVSITSNDILFGKMCYHVMRCDLLFNKIETEEGSGGEKTFISSFMGLKTMNLVVVHVECEQNQKKMFFDFFHRNSLRLCCLRECFYSMPLSRVFFCNLFCLHKGNTITLRNFWCLSAAIVDGFFSLSFFTTFRFVVKIFIFNVNETITKQKSH